ncbi:hypothetical protein LIER_25388 [Lithospermum erythrorhizon]|uniref:Transposase n=1 Tax=Lithospermum erythrorhizon TaxID=34254 RepID=A0AAV3R8W2_LITER
MTCSFVYSFVDSSEIPPRDDEVEKDELGFEEIDIDEDNKYVDEIGLEGINEASTDLLVSDHGVEGLEGDEVQANDVCIGILKKDYDLKSNLVLGGKLFHVRCCAHIINLLVRDGLKEIDHIVDVIREGVKYLFGSENRLDSFNEHRINLKLTPKKLVLDNNTR